MCRPCTRRDVVPSAAEGKSVSEIARDPRVLHDPRTVAKVLGGRTSRNTHGGRRRDVLGPEGRAWLAKLCKLFPQTTDSWRARAMSKVIGKRVRVGVVRTAYRHLGLTSLAPTILYWSMQCIVESPPPERPARCRRYHSVGAS